MDKFTTGAELKLLAMSLDTAEDRKVFVSKPGFPDVEAKDYKGIFNLDKGDVACIASKKYAIIQMRDAFQEVAEVLTELNLGVSGKLENMGNVVRADIIFANCKVESPKRGDIVSFGVRIVNSFDKSHSFYGELYANRLVCTNGMVLGKAVGGVTFSKWHMGKPSVRREIRQFIEDARNANVVLKDLIDRAFEDSIEWDMTKKILGKLVHIKKYRLMVEKELENKPEITRWELYNAITSVATHNESLTFGVQEYLQNRAQDVLRFESPKLIAMAIEVEDDGSE